MKALTSQWKKKQIRTTPTESLSYHSAELSSRPKWKRAQNITEKKNKTKNSKTRIKNKNWTKPKRKETWRFTGQLADLSKHFTIGRQYRIFVWNSISARCLKNGGRGVHGERVSSDWRDVGRSQLSPSRSTHVRN